MRDNILIFVNGQRHEESGADALQSLSDFLRKRLALVGTKIVCSEGDCGACTVLVGRTARDAQNGRPIVYQAVDSCILMLFQLDGCHVVTVEGIGDEQSLTPLQQSMVACHGSQCGFCTPGFVMAMTGMLEQTSTLSGADLRYGLTGNLCRCTGYSPILQSGESFSSDVHRRIDALYSPATIIDEMRAAAATPFHVVCRDADRELAVYGPTTVAEAVQLRNDYPDARLVAGATDLGVQINKGAPHADVTIDLNRVAELEGVRFDGDTLVAGARATWTEIEHALEDRASQFHEILTRFGAPQIRNVGTIGGNIANASPIADSLPFLYVCEAEVELTGNSGERRVNINDFYTGYKQTAIKPSELITRVFVPLPRPDEVLRLYKVSKRRDLDIASFTAAIRIELDDRTIRSAAVSFGAVGPTVIRARRTEASLIGRNFCEETWRAAGDVAIEEISPITDVRGTKEYRTQLTRNVLLKFYHEIEEAGATASV